ncbi:MAG TPA: excinuclease ABC subunit UvrA [Acidimicrobiia bacterium]|nr:excinuclease ABC subunit UvrA [Acidimicrobiia bacterium]
MPTDQITIRGARQHNLKDLTLAIPRDRLVVFTGLSGSGKSSLAHDTIYAEGQRRYVESLSAYARQFLGPMERPDLDGIDGLSPTISIDQKGGARNPRSTVGTMTEVYDYLRLLFARVGLPHCPICGREIHKQTIEQMADRIEEMPEGTRLIILGPVVRGRRGEYERLLDEIRKQGFSRVRVDGRVYDLGEKISISRQRGHDIEVVVDRIAVTHDPDHRTRLVDSLEVAAKLGRGSVLLAPVDGGEISMSQDYVCAYDGTSVAEPEPRHFSFNTPEGACPVCAGLGAEPIAGESNRSERPCPVCGGARLKPESLAVSVAGLNIAEVAGLSVTEAIGFFESLELSDREETVARGILDEIRARLRFMVDVGLDYLTLARSATSLSGGETQRIRLATQIGSGLSGCLYVLDEPSVGLHQRDNRRLINTLLRLRDLGNSLIVVEHDEEIIRAADWIIDFGPGAGEQGGQVVAAGTLSEVMDDRRSLTAAYLRGDRRVRVPERRRTGNGKKLVIRGAAANNLKGIDVEIPLGSFVTVSGVSGSGKSSLVEDILAPRLAQHFDGARDEPGPHASIEGLEHLDKAIHVDQSPIGRTPRSNPATYTGVFTQIRELFAALPEARMRGYGPDRFSFNVKGGRCEACQGEGTLQIEMQFLPDVYVTCEVCQGTRYSREVLEVRFRGRSIADVLDITVDEAMRVFENIPRVMEKLRTLRDVGLGYIRLGQPASRLSGGEAQRVKLSTALSRRSTGRAIYLLDEPTTGLHYADVEQLLNVLHRLVDQGNTVVVVEHNLDVLKTADWLVDLGPEAGARGGEVVAAGTPEQVAANPASYTGAYLRQLLHGTTASAA